MDNPQCGHGELSEEKKKELEDLISTLQIQLADQLESNQAEKDQVDAENEEDIQRLLTINNSLQALLSNPDLSEVVEMNLRITLRAIQAALRTLCLPLSAFDADGGPVEASWIVFLLNGPFQDHIMSLYVIKYSYLLNTI